MSTYYLSRGDETMIFHRTHVTDHGRKPIADSWRPVVVIDPEDREAVERLVFGFLEHYWSEKYDTHTDAGQAALRELAEGGAS